MKYRNTKTGATINSPFNINGGNWEVFEPGEVEKEKEAVENEEYVEQEINLDEMTKAELVELAKEHEIEVDEKDTKQVIIEAITKAFE